MTYTSTVNPDDLKRAEVLTEVPRESMTDVVKENSMFIDALLQALRRVENHIFGIPAAKVESVEKAKDPECIMEDLSMQRIALRIAVEKLATLSSQLGV